jgi:hypothetical protein
MLSPDTSTCCANGGRRAGGVSIPQLPWRSAGCFQAEGPVREGLMLSGCAQHRIGSSSTSPSLTVGAIVAPGETADLHYRSNFDQFVLVIKPAPLRNKLQALTGSPSVAPLKFATTLSYERPEGLALRRLVHLLAEESQAGDQATSPLVLAELEQAIMVSFPVRAPTAISAIHRHYARV